MKVEVYEEEVTEALGGMSKVDEESNI